MIATTQFCSSRISPRECEKDYVFNFDDSETQLPRAEDGITLFFVTTGKLRYLKDNRVAILKPFHLLLIGMNPSVEIRVDSTCEKVEGVAILISRNTLNVLTEFDENEGVLLNKFFALEWALARPNALLIKLLQRMIKAKPDFVSKQQFHFIVRNLLFENWRHENLLYALNAINSSTKKDILSKLIEARSVIDANFHKNLTLNELALKIGMSKYHFVRQFKLVFKETPVERLINQRIGQAEKLLKSSDLTISEVARQCGFANLYYFSNTFKRLNGHSPTAYRLQSDPGR